MDTVIIEVRNNKAYKLLDSLEELKLIRVLRKKHGGISNLRGKMQTPMSGPDIDKQLNATREEWQRDS